MIRGVLLLATGYSLGHVRGYTKAMRDLDPEDIQDLVKIGKEFFANATQAVRESVKDRRAEAEKVEIITPFEPPQGEPS